MTGRGCRGLQGTRVCEASQSCPVPRALSPAPPPSPTLGSNTRTGHQMLQEEQSYNASMGMGYNLAFQPKLHATGGNRVFRGTKSELFGWKGEHHRERCWDKVLKGEAELRLGTAVPEISASASPLLLGSFQDSPLSWKNKTVVYETILKKFHSCFMHLFSRD